MTTQVFIRILQAAALHAKVDLDPSVIHSLEDFARVYQREHFFEFRRDFIEAGRGLNMLVVEQTVPGGQLEKFIRESNECIALFSFSESSFFSELVVSEKGKIKSLLNSPPPDFERWTSKEDEPVSLFVIMPYKGIVSEYHQDKITSVAQTPLARFFRLLGTERKEIGYVMVYALFIGLLGLALPLGLQNTIELISGGLFFSSVYILIGMVIVGMLFIGVLQIIQISMVEHLQRRLFAKAAFEFAFRIPRIRLEALTKSYAPELVNRFFDIITIQKGLPKILLDLSAAAIQIFFGLLLLSLYHPFFVFFSLLLIGMLVTMFYVTGPRGLDSSINESKYKYKVVHWLEEMARAIKSFKLAGNTDLPIRKADYVTSNYIKYRKKHFGILLSQLSFFIFFKVAIAGGLLIVGTALVVNREITLGQFVASEVVIILVLNAVEKLVLYTDIVYDLLTAVEKVSHVTDLPIERAGGANLSTVSTGHAVNVATHNLSYGYPDAATTIIKNISLSIGAGEHVCIAGPGGSGKTTFTNIIAGLYSDYSGGISINNLSMRDLDLSYLRDRVANNISPEDIFDGTLYENITIGKPATSVSRVMKALDAVGLHEHIMSLPEGLNTPVVSGGKGLSSSTIHRLILARCLAKDPGLIILNDFFSGLSKADKLELIRCVIDSGNEWTLIAESNDPLIMAACDRVIVMDAGQVVADGPYQELLKDGVIGKYFE